MFNKNPFLVYKTATGTWKLIQFILKICLVYTRAITTQNDSLLQYLFPACSPFSCFRWECMTAFTYSGYMRWALFSSTSLVYNSTDYQKGRHSYLPMHYSFLSWSTLCKTIRKGYVLEYFSLWQCMNICQSHVYY